MQPCRKVLSMMAYTKCTCTGAWWDIFSVNVDVKAGIFYTYININHRIHKRLDILHENGGIYKRTGACEWWNALHVFYMYL